MPTKKKITRNAKVDSVPPVKPNGAKRRTARRNGSVSSRAAATSSYVIPGAAVLGTGALAAAGYVLREELAGLVHGVVETLAKTTRRVSAAKMLSLLGVERKRSFLSMVLPELGGFAVGLASGAVLTLWLAPKWNAHVDEVVTGSTETASPHYSGPAVVPPVHVS